MSDPPPPSRSGPSSACDGGLLAAHVALTLALGAWLNVWIDESFTLVSTGAGPRFALERAIGYEYQPPLYFVALSVWRLADPSLWFARLPSALATAAAIVLVLRACRRIAPGAAAPALAAALAFHPFLLYAATEVRLYGALVLIGAGLWTLYVRGFLDPEPRRSARRGFVVLAIAGLYTQYYVAVALAAFGIVLVATRRWDAVRHFVVAGVAIVVAFVPLALLIPGQMVAHGDAAATTPGLVDLLRSLYVRCATFLLPAPQGEGLVVARRIRDIVLIASMAAAAAVGLPRLARARQTEALAAVGVAALSVAGFGALLVVTGSPESVKPRHMAVAFAPMVIAASALVAAAWGRRAVLVACLVVAASSALTSAYVYRAGAKRGDWVRVARHLERHGNADEPVLVFHSPSWLSLTWHYAGAAEVLALPGPPPTDRWHLPDYVVPSAAHVANVVAGARGGGDAIWLVTDQIDAWMGIDFNRPAVERFAREGYRVADDRWFFQSRVRKLVREP